MGAVLPQAADASQFGPWSVNDTHHQPIGTEVHRSFLTVIEMEREGT